MSILRSNCFSKSTATNKQPKKSDIKPTFSCGWVDSDRLLKAMSKLQGVTGGS